MEETLIVTSERVDDIPVLVAHMARMGLQRLVDEQFRVHGNWQGLSLGWVTVLWLSHILSEADHRLNHVQLWAEKRLETLCGCSGQTVRALDLSDDRLARVLSALGHDTCWAAFESALNGHLLRVYDLNPQRVRVDSTTVSGRWEVTPDGLFQFGRSKDHRPDLPQVKVMLSSLDPLGMPVATQVVSGEKADDPLYGPAITQVRQGLGRRGLLYVGDCKMGALSTRAFIQEGGDYYLCPLGRRQLSAEVLSTYLVPVWAGEQALVPVYRQGQEGEEEQLAEGYERLETLSAEVEGKTIRWDERRLVLKSLQQARIEQDSLAIRLGRAETDLAALNARKRNREPFGESAPLREVAESILKRHDVAGLLQLDYVEVSPEHPLQTSGRKRTPVRSDKETHIRVARDEQAIAAKTRTLGWRVYVTNQPAEQLPLPQAVPAYRNEFSIEHDFGRLKGKPLSLAPMYLQDDVRATGLIRLLSIGLRLLTLLEFVARRNLVAEGGKLPGLYAGNPKRATTRPTAERLLESFKETTLTILSDNQREHRHLTPLSALQQKILALLDLSPDLYTILCTPSQPP